MPSRRKTRKPRAQKSAATTPSQPGTGDSPSQTSGHSTAKINFTSRLEVATVAYIAFPAFLFLFGFFRLIYAAPAALAFAAGIYFYFKHAAAANFITARGIIPDSPKISGVHIALSFIAAVAASILFGAGGWGHQAQDLLTNNAMLTHHIAEAWPVVIDRDGTEYFIVYYFAYLLPAIAVGKLFGFAAANHVLFIWTVLGVFLALLWLFVFSRSAAKWILVVFLFFSGMDIVGAALFTDIFTSDHLREFLFSRAQHLEWWVLTLDFHRQYSSTLTQIAWVPRHALPAWLLTSLLLKNIAARRPLHSAAFIIGLGVTWSAFVPIGLALLMLIYYAVNYKTIAIRPAFSAENFLVLPMVFCTAAFFFANTTGAGHVLSLDSLENNRLFYYLAVFVLEFGLLWALLFAAQRFAGKNGIWSAAFQKLFIVAAAVAFLLLWVGNPDLQKNAGYPAWFVLALACIRLLETLRLPKFERARKFAYASVAMLVIGAVTPLVEAKRAVGDIIGRGAIYQAVEKRSILDLPYNWEDHIVAGDLQSAYWRWFARER